MQKRAILFFLFVASIFSPLSTLSETSDSPVYKPNVAVGPFQKVGTLSPISLKAQPEATEAVILVPGLNSVKLSAELYEWKALWHHWQVTKAITPEQKKNYRFYVFHYEGWDSLFKSSETLTTGIKQLLLTEPNIKKINFIGYSQGGIIPRIVLSNNLDLEQITGKVITFAAPHQGAVVLTKKLVADTIKLQNPFDKIKNTKFLQIFTTWYHSAYLEQAWSNFDNGLPESANYTVPEPATKIPTPPNINKFIPYASYIYPLKPDDFEDKIKFLVTETIPRSVLDRRAGTTQLNRWTAKKVYPDEKPNFRDHLRKNDGVTPLVSGLWGRMCRPEETQPTSWCNLFPTNNFCPSTSLQRAFYGPDHLRWREDISARAELQDKLHPDIEPKSIYDWAFIDLTSTGL
jgi:hypothetical protein